MCLYQRLTAVTQLFSQGSHKYTQGGFAVIRRSSPYTLDNVLMCQHVQFFIIKINTARNIVYPQSAVDKLRDRYVFGSHEPPLYHPEPCEKFINRERLCQVIICTFVKGCYLIPVLAPCTDYDDRNIAPSAYMLYDLNAINALSMTASLPLTAVIKR